ncbi:MAG TPA: hypothetical protein VIF37_01240 [Methylobacter sp.]|jgi:hypothetical protein
MSNGLFETRALKFLCTALILALMNGCNPEKQWQKLEITGYLSKLHQI